MNISVIHPCFNEEENIEQTVTETLAWFDREEHDGEVVIVDDGSKDRSGEMIKKMRSNDTRIIIVTHEHNQGYGIAVRSGCDKASKEYIAFIDSDGQFHISDLSVLLPFLTEYDFVPGRRRKRADPFIRNLFGKILGVLIFLTFGLWVRDVNCGMKVFKKVFGQQYDHSMEQKNSSIQSYTYV